MYKHRELVLSLMMTTSDLCSSCKVWEDHRHSVDALFEEFYLQVKAGSGLRARLHYNCGGL